MSVYVVDAGVIVPDATQAQSGLLSAADKAKLDGITWVPVMQPILPGETYYAPSPMGCAAFISAGQKRKTAPALCGA